MGAWENRVLGDAKGRRLIRAMALAPTVAVLMQLAGYLEPQNAAAHPGNTDSAGGHTCYTNCPSWDLSYGQYHTHGGLPDGPDPPNGLGGFCFSERCRIDKAQRQMDRLVDDLLPKTERLAEATAALANQEAEAAKLGALYADADSTRDDAVAAAVVAQERAEEAESAYLERLGNASERVVRRDATYEDAREEWNGYRAGSLVLATGFLLAALVLAGLPLLLPRLRKRIEVGASVSAYASSVVLFCLVLAGAGVTLWATGLLGDSLRLLVGLAVAAGLLACCAVLAWMLARRATEPEWQWFAVGGIALGVSAVVIAAAGFGRAEPEKLGLPGKTLEHAARYSDEPEDNLPTGVERLLAISERKELRADAASAEADEIDRLIEQVESNHREMNQLVDELEPEIADLEADMADIQARLAGLGAG